MGGGGGGALRRRPLRLGKQAAPPPLRRAPRAGRRPSPQQRTHGAGQRDPAEVVHVLHLCQRQRHGRHDEAGHDGAQVV
jgi:hypothetical protein